MKFKALAFSIAFCGGLALSQTTLGSMFQLGSSTSASLHTPSITITGSLIYDVDAGNPRFTDGVACNHMAWTVGVACPSGYVLTLASNNGALTCVNYVATAGSASTATTATQLASDPSDCAANQYATGIAANGNLTCAGVTGGQVTGAVATATALASNPSDCAANQYAHAIAANGDLTCAGVTGGQVTGAVATATALDANPSDCTGDTFAYAIAANGNLSCQNVVLGAQSPTPSTCPAHSYVTGIDKYGNVSCGPVLAEACCAYY